jgi:hypothetical protein
MARKSFTGREVDVLRILANGQGRQFTPSFVGNSIKDTSKAPSALGGFYLRTLTQRGLVIRKGRGRYQISGRGRRALSRI